MDTTHTVTAESRQLVEPGNRICVKVWMEMLMLRPPVSNKNKNHFYCTLFSQIREILVPQFDYNNNDRLTAFDPGQPG